MDGARRRLAARGGGDRADGEGDQSPDVELVMEFSLQPHNAHRITSFLPVRTIKIELQTIDINIVVFVDYTSAHSFFLMSSHPNINPSLFFI